MLSLGTIYSSTYSSLIQNYLLLLGLPFTSFNINSRTCYKVHCYSLLNCICRLCSSGSALYVRHGKLYCFSVWSILFCSVLGSLLLIRIPVAFLLNCSAGYCAVMMHCRLGIVYPACKVALRLCIPIPDS